MALKRHHKILIGSFTSIVIIFMIVMGFLMYTLYVKQATDIQNLNNQISNLQTDTQTKVNELSLSILKTNQSITNEVGNLNQSLNQQFDLLKASAGQDFSGIINNVVKSVVTIRTDSAQGTGFLISNDGYIVTNVHVIADQNGYLANNIQAINYNQQIINAQFIGYDGSLDIALLKINGSYIPLTLDDSNNIQVGQKVIAIGNPLGLQFSVSQGIISAINRPFNGLNAYIQTDASLNFGNSGGPLIATDGKVIGINNFKVNSGTNLGFALESNYIRSAVNKISQQQLNLTLIP